MATSRSRGRSGRPWERAKARVKATATHCCKCGRELYPELQWPHKWSTSIDHIVPLHLGGDPLDPNNLDAAHLYCNIREGSAIAKAGRQQRGEQPQSYRDPRYQ